MAGNQVIQATRKEVYLPDAAMYETNEAFVLPRQFINHRQAADYCPVFSCTIRIISSAASFGIP